MADMIVGCCCRGFRSDNSDFYHESAACWSRWFDMLTIRNASAHNMSDYRWMIAETAYCSVLEVGKVWYFAFVLLCVWFQLPVSAITLLIYKAVLKWMVIVCVGMSGSDGKVWSCVSLPSEKRTDVSSSPLCHLVIFSKVQSSKNDIMPNDINFVWNLSPLGRLSFGS